MVRGFACQIRKMAGRGQLRVRRYSERARRNGVVGGKQIEAILRCTEWSSYSKPARRGKINVDIRNRNGRDAAATIGPPAGRSKAGFGLDFPQIVLVCPRPPPVLPCSCGFFCCSLPVLPAKPKIRRQNVIPKHRQNDNICPDHRVCIQPPDVNQLPDRCQLMLQ